MLTASPLLGIRGHQDEKDKNMEYFVAYTILITSLLGLMVALYATVKFRDTFYVASTVGFYLTTMISLTMVDAIYC